MLVLKQRSLFRYKMIYERNRMMESTSKQINENSTIVLRKYAGVATMVEICALKKALLAIIRQ